MSRIHPTAVVDPRAQIDETVTVGPNAIIDAHVRIGRGTTVYANAYITGHTTIGADNAIHMGAVIGHEPQDYSFDKTIRSYLEIGDNNIIREYCTIHRGTKPESATTIGSGNFLMGGVHVAHNCAIGNNVIAANYVMLGGYVRVGDNVFISGGAGIHQFVSVGRLAMLSGNGRYSNDIPPFVTAFERNVTEGVNLVGLRRAGCSREAIREIKKVYTMLYLSEGTRQQVLEAMEQEAWATAEAREFIAFVREAKRPLVQHARRARR